jgi:oligopeptide transport system ATP-binding protein
MSKLLEVKDLRVSFNTYNGEVHAVRGVTFDLNKGETLAIVGESGSGKSVTSNAIMRLLPEPHGYIKEGQILLEGVDLAKKTSKEMQKIRGKDISMVFQDPMSSLNPTMKIGYQIMEGLMKHQNMSKTEARKTALELLTLVVFLGRMYVLINTLTNSLEVCVNVW